MENAAHRVAMSPHSQRLLHWGYVRRRRSSGLRLCSQQATPQRMKTPMTTTGISIKAQPQF